MLLAMNSWQKSKQVSTNLTESKAKKIVYKNYLTYLKQIC